jgi:hypothetical protein
MPPVIYLRCHRPLVHEVEHLARVVVDARVEYAIYDSVAFACDGAPEAAEVAGNYFRGVKAIGIGSLHVAHVWKAEGADQRPVGSAFWHNGARSTWFAKVADVAGRSAGVGRRRELAGSVTTATVLPVMSKKLD